ncbi:MAG: iron-sulfur cluster assembly accessory protein [Acidobacteria bacterium]|nr:iron-sulfur cluster assembly accessory protein [Acidobacteriota bacterium]
MIQLTENASAQIEKLLTKHNLIGGGLRVGVKAGGCSGFEYTFAWEQTPRDGDHVFEGARGARIFVDPRSLRILDGTVLDYDMNLISRGFVFNNPHAKSTCGCGHSFSVS